MPLGRGDMAAIIMLLPLAISVRQFSQIVAAIWITAAWGCGNGIAALYPAQEIPFLSLQCLRLLWFLHVLKFQEVLPAALLNCFPKSARNFLTFCTIDLKCYDFAEQCCFEEWKRKHWEESVDLTKGFWTLTESNEENSTGLLRKWKKTTTNDFWHNTEQANHRLEIVLFRCATVWTQRCHTKREPFLFGL